MYEVTLFIEHGSFKTTISNIKNTEDLETLIDYGYVEIKDKKVTLNLEQITLIITFDEKNRIDEDVLDGRDYYGIKKVTAYFSEPNLREIDLSNYFSDERPFRISLGKIITID